MIQIAHVSDLHLTGDLDHDGHAIKLLARVLAAHPEAHLLVTGDLVNDGTEEQYRAAAVALRPWRGRLLACCGNHDLCAAGNFYDADAPARWRLHVEPIIAEHPVDGWLTYLADHDGTRVRCIGLDSVAHTLNPLDFARGEVGEKQREALLATLNRSAEMDTPTLVYLHHKPFPIGGLMGAVEDLADWPELREILDGVVDVVCYGHTGANQRSDYQPGTALARGTVYLDANRSVSTGSYYLIMFRAGERSPHVEQRSIEA